MKRLVAVLAILIIGAISARASDSIRVGVGKTGRYITAGQVHGGDAEGNGFTIAGMRWGKHERGPVDVPRYVAPLE